MTRGGARGAERPTHLWWIVLALAACSSSFTEVDGGGPDGSSHDAVGAPDLGDIPSCTGTALRAHQPLGEAGDDSYEASLAPLAGGGAAVVWEESTVSGGSSSIFWARADVLGKVTGATRLLTGQDPALLRQSDGLRLFWRDASTSALMTYRLDDNGVPGSAAQKVHSPLTSSFVVADSGKVFGVALNGVSPKGDVAHFMLVGHDGVAKGQPVEVPQHGINSTLASIAWTGAGFALAWTDMRESLPAVYFAQWSDQGKRISTDRRLSDAGVRGSFPTVAAQAGGGIVVCYQQKMQTDLHDIFCSRLDAGGNPTHRKRLTQNAYSSQNPQAVTHGRHTWVVWDDVSDINDGTALHWQFLTESGDTVLQPKTFPELLGWRPHPLAAEDGLYVTKYRQTLSDGWKAELGVLNCF